MILFNKNHFDNFLKSKLYNEKDVEKKTKSSSICSLVSFKKNRVKDRYDQAMLYKELDIIKFIQQLRFTKYAFKELLTGKTISELK